MWQTMHPFCYREMKHGPDEKVERGIANMTFSKPMVLLK